MRKFLGFLLVIVGSLLLLVNYFPDYAVYLSHLGAITVVPFWGVVLVLGGGYFLLKNEAARTGLGLALVVFIVVYLVGATAGSPTLSIGGWSVPVFTGGRERIEGKSRSLGTYRANGIVVENVAAELVFTGTEGDVTEVTTNLPLTADESGGRLTIKCASDCKKYKNGEIRLEVGKGLTIRELSIRDTVGSITMNLGGPFESVRVSNFVGELKIEGLASGELKLEDFIGDIYLGVESLDRLEVSEGIGDVSITLPENYRIDLTSKSLLSKLNTSGDVQQGEEVLEFAASNLIGQITVTKP